MLKTSNETRLAPIYDFAPMKFDREGIVRSTRWPNNIEEGDFEALSNLLISEYELDKTVWLKKLNSFRIKTAGLKDLMVNKGINKEFVKGTSVDRNRLQKSIELYCEKNI